MTTNPSPISIAFVFRRRPAIAPPALKIHASFAPLPLASASTASSSLPAEAPERPLSNVRTVRRSPAIASAAHSSAFKSKPPLRFPHSG
jgi:hypothetical protein